MKEYPHELRIKVFENKEELGRLGANLLAEMIKEGAKSFGFPTGRSPKPVFEQFKELLKKDKLNLSNINLIWMDEYVFNRDTFYELPPENAEYSCRYYAREIINAWNKFLPSSHRLKNFYFPDPNNPSAYEKLIKNLGGIDLFITAAGSTDGHVAFNSPGTPLNSGTRIIKLTETTRKDNLRTFETFENKLENVPTYGVSVGLGTILESKRIVFVAHGKEKQKMVERVLNSKKFDSSFLATFLWAAKEKVEILLDKESLPS